MTASELVEPAYRTGPKVVRTLGPEVGDLADLAGFAPDPEQQLGLDMLFAFDDAGQSSAFELAVVCSRQNLKTALFKQAALGWLFLTDQNLIVWSAHEFRTAQEAFRDMEILIGSSSWLSKRLKKVHYAAGSEAIELSTGQRLIFKARTSSGGRGLTGDKVVLDEAFALRPDHMGALLPTLSVRPDPQIVYGSSAGLHGSEVLRRIRDRGRGGSSERLAYLEWSAARRACADEACTHEPGEVDGCQLDDVDNWRAANPLLGRTRSNGTGLTVEYVAAERAALPPEEFARERLGWWDEPGTAEVFGPRKWEAGYRDERPEGLRVGGLAVAISYDLKHSAVVAAGRDGDDVWVKPLRHGPGTGWLVETCQELQAAHQVEMTIDGKGPGAMMVPHLERAGIRLRVMATNDVLDACAGLETLVQDDRLRHEVAPELDEAVTGAVRRDVGDRWAWGRRKATSDISPLEAATFAAWAVDEPTTVSAYADRGVLTV